MFKKIEIWIVYLICLLGIPLTIFFGVLVRQELVGSIKFAKISKTALFLAEIPVNIKKALQEKNDLEEVDRFPLLDDFNGTHNSSKSYMLLSRFDGDLGEGIVELVDLTNFSVLHTWNPDIDEFNRLVEKNIEFERLNIDRKNSRQILSHPKLVKDGGLLFGAESPLRKIDACSNLIFQVKHDIFHHSIEIDIDGNIWAPSYIYPQSLPSEKVGRDPRFEKGYRDDAVVKLSSNGEILFEKSVSQIFIDNRLEYLLFSASDNDFFNADPIHLNDIQPVNFDGKFWKKGDVFLSLRHQSMVLLYRPSTNKVIWTGTGLFFHQHDVDILNDHKISIFNNNSKRFLGGDVVDGNNEVITYDFRTSKYSTYLNESLKKQDVKTITQGLSQILPNGDLFLEETNYGRILYFDSDGTLRWSYVNRSSNGKIYGLGWSRILYDYEDIKTVKNLLKLRSNCND